MSGSESAEDRTEAATQRRLEQAREEGQLPVSRDLGTLASLGGAAIGAIMFAPAMAHRFADQSAALLGQVQQIRLADGSVLGGPVTEVVFSAAMLVGAVALPAAACGITCTLLQTQFYIGSTPIHFQPSRISPGAGFARLFSQRHLLDFLKSCARLAIVCALLWGAIRNSPDSALQAVNADLSRLLPFALGQVANLARPLLVALAAFAVLDVFLVRFQHARSLRMSRQEVRDEARQTDGDPMVKGRLRRLRDQRARRRMMAKVKTATVVVTNPTHYAVALSYESAGAPKVIAKGVDFLAARIREEAEAHKVPVVANPPLARSLYKLDLDQEIPVELYRAVAEVIAFVWKLKARMAPAGARP